LTHFLESIDRQDFGVTREGWGEQFPGFPGDNGSKFCNKTRRQDQERLPVDGTARDFTARVRDFDYSASEPCQSKVTINGKAVQ